MRVIDPAPCAPGLYFGSPILLHHLLLGPHFFSAAVRKHLSTSSLVAIFVFRFDCSFHCVQKPAPTANMAISFADPIDLQRRMQAAGVGIPNNDIILSYFATCPFFDPESVNQELFLQNKDRDIMEQLAKFPGLQFVVDNEFQTSAPRLFVINKILRQVTNGRTTITTLDVFYCLDGVIMRAPHLMDLIRTRFGKAAMHLQKSFESLFAHKIPCENTPTLEDIQENNDESFGMEI
jgi:hypothetical protein